MRITFAQLGFSSRNQLSWDNYRERPLVRVMGPHEEAL
jgi:hypothetical protein